MRVSGYVDRERFGGVVVSERVEASVPLERFVTSRLGSLDPLPMPDAMRLFFTPPSQDGVAPWNFHGPIHLRPRQGCAPVSLEGLARYDSVSALVEFALRRIDPAGSGSLSRVVADAHAEGDRARVTLERSLTGEPLRRHPYHFPTPHRPRSPDHRRLPIVSSVEFDDALAVVEGVCGDRLLVPTTAHYLLGPVLAREIELEVAGRALPRLSYVLALDGNLSGDSDGPAVPVVAFDGHRHRWLQSVLDLPLAEADALDRCGTAYRRSLYDLLPMPHLRARCLIMLPERAALEPALSSPQTGPSHAHQRLLDRPGYVLDSRSPIELPGEVPIIDDPAEVAFVLARTTKGIFVPADRAAVGFPAERLPDGRHVLVLADVREDLFPCG